MQKFVKKKIINNSYKRLTVYISLVSKVVILAVDIYIYIIFVISTTKYSGKASFIYLAVMQSFVL